MGFYESKVALADRLIKRYGRTLTLKRRAVAFNAEFGNADETVTSYAIYGALFPYKFNEIDGSTIKHGDVNCLVAGNVEGPKLGDLVALDGKDWNVVAIEPLAPGGVIVMYSINLRQ